MHSANKMLLFHFFVRLSFAIFENFLHCVIEQIFNKSINRKIFNKLIINFFGLIFFDFSFLYLEFLLSKIWEYFSINFLTWYPTCSLSWLQNIFFRIRNLVFGVNENEKKHLHHTALSHFKIPFSMQAASRLVR